MQRQALEQIIHYQKKSEKDVLLAVQQNDLEALKSFEANHVKFDKLKVFKEAVEYISYDCALHIFKSLTYPTRDAWKALSPVFLEACKGNNQALLEQFKAIFKHVGGELICVFFQDHWAPSLFYEPLQVDPGNGYTALHWCVVNKISFIFDYHLKVYAKVGEAYQVSDTFEDLMFAKDHGGRTILDLATMLGNIDALQKISRLLRFEKVIHQCDVVFFKAILKHKLKFRMQYVDMLKDPERIKEKLINLMSQIDDAYQETVLNAVLDEKHALSQFLLRDGKGNDDAHAKAVVAQMLLELLNKKEQSAPTSTAILLTNFSYSDSKTDHVEQVSLLSPSPVLEPVYIPREQIHDYLNTKQFRAIFPDVPQAEKVVKNKQGKEGLELNLI